MRWIIGMLVVGFVGLSLALGTPVVYGDGGDDECPPDSV